MTIWDSVSSIKWTIMIQKTFPDQRVVTKKTNKKKCNNLKKTKKQKNAAQENLKPKEEISSLITKCNELKGKLINNCLHVWPKEHFMHI